MGQVWAVNSLGGHMYSDNLSKKLRKELQPMVKFRQFCDAKDATALVEKGKGAVFHWNVYSKVATQGGTLVETNTMPETQFTITQGTLTITEYGKIIAYLRSSCRKLLKPFRPTDATVERIKKWTTRIRLTLNWHISPALLTVKAQ